MRRQRRSFRLLALIFGVALLAAACGDDDEGGGATDETEETEPSGAIGGSAIIGGEQIPSGLNVNHSAHNAFWTALFMEQIWPNAYYFQPDGTFELNEDLVTNAEITDEDPQTVVWEINPDAVWSDGEPITADDFLFSWETQNGAPQLDASGQPVLDPETGQPVPLYNAAATAGYDTSTCEAVDDQTFQCVWEDTKFADWQSLYQGITPRHAFQAEGNGDEVVGFNEGFVFPDVNLDNVPSGGPWIISEVDGETSLTLSRNEEYWGEPPVLDEIVIRWITDPTQQPAALENGEADIIFPQAQVDLVNQTQNIAGVTPVVDFGTFYEHMDFNFSNVHLAKQEVRQAVGLALDRQDIVTRLPGQMSDDAEVMNNHFFYPGGAAYEPNGEETYGQQDIEGARARLEEAGYVAGADGIYAHPADGRLSIRLAWRTPNPRREQTAELVQSYLGDAGIDLTFDPKPDFTFLDSGDFDIALFGWTNITVPSGHSDEFRTNGGNNNGNYSNSEVDDLLTEADAELDPDARLDLLNEIDVILWEDLPTITLFQVPEFLAYNDDFENVEQNGYDGFMYNSRVWAQAQ